MSFIRATFTSAVDLRLFLLENPNVVEILQKQQLWQNFEKNPLMEIAKKDSNDEAVNKTLLRMAKVLVEEFDVHLEARFEQEDLSPFGKKTKCEYRIQWKSSDEKDSVGKELSL